MSAPLSAYDNDIQYAWDATSLSAFTKCPRYYQLSILEGWKKKGHNPHLLFGGVYAKALETFFKHRAEGMDYDKAQAEVVLLALHKTWGDEFTPEDEPPGPWESSDNVKTRENLIRTIVWYLENFRDDPLPTYHFADGKPAVELSFRLEISDDYLYCGHLDKVVEYGNDLYVSDQKTTKSTITPKYFEGYNPSHQMTGYSFAGQIVLNVPIKGVIIDAAQIMVGGSRFTRGFTVRTSQQIDEWLDHSLYWIDQAVNMSERGFFPMNPESCNNYGGCPFRVVCSRTPGIRDKFLHGDFEQRPRWDPLEVR